ncbi:MarR family winged helix-turn-helix transcriptional regulator [Leucobacter japonicus]|uniref:MarR family winged helix-turn-helix transcriptional regulator n=1 Tax=Leucobacter japonicus TaxID=1461259 RepID=UPI0006A78389|nr:MarR family transcriptional regulator [Leucobacter japonicus]
MHDASAPAAHPDAAAHTDQISDIIAEFSEVFAFARTRWARYAEEVDPELKGVGIMVLQLILRKGPITATGISQLLDMDKAMVSRQITKLRDLGLVDTEPSPEDRRVVLLTPSPKAEDLLGAVRAQWAHAYHERFVGWSPDELEHLRAALHRFNAASADSLRTDTPAARCARDSQAQSGDGGSPDPATSSATNAE